MERTLKDEKLLWEMVVIKDQLIKYIEERYILDRAEKWLSAHPRCRNKRRR